MTEETQTSDGAPAGMSDSTQLLERSEFDASRAVMIHWNEYQT